ncbi:23S rRNA (uracil(1939)-C(5))-methyltransferase RlmD [Spirulina sp. CCNP1310]|uniref:23S rRNA (uracil(1939)-C(5))-methyltransferase RlmD n=1 Tax=Spirulina sp. CCNP1310 TaxID=3110249 RepID=UPI002B20E9E9|nr:23S rRNA (uracil(1939)-C(5))-methyltransferase RlmD [Spirulina sp. CCNP1310]MEA5420443.1 23S rRNA (uracil(1939)-C(5))-methyltransferase RlmD [Spirulina sp. CCNP1310]
MSDPANLWQQGHLLDVDVVDLSDRGDGVARWGDRVIFIPDTVPGDRLQVRLTHVKPQYAHAKLVELLTPSPQRIRPRCIVADKCGGCQWQHIDDAAQGEAKVNLLTQALQRIGGFQDLAIAPLLSGDPLHYRNKATYPLSRSSHNQGVQAGYYRKGTHQVVNLNQCPVQDQRLDPLLAEVKQDIASQGWSIYNEERHQGRLRHLALRIGRRTGEMLLTLVSTEETLTNIEEQAQAWMTRYPDLVGVCINHNPQRNNIIFGPDTYTIAGRSYLAEQFAGLTLHLRPETFFQVNTEVAEQLLGVIERQLQLQGNEVLLDAYCGIGTFTLPLARQVQRAIGVESQATAITQAKANAKLNNIQNVQFYAQTVESWVYDREGIADVVILDPPRKGCDRTVLDSLLRLQPARIVYVSCKPSTLARDLQHLCSTGQYKIEHIQPADFFPQTPHGEAVAFLERVTAE